MSEVIINCPKWIAVVAALAVLKLAWDTLVLVATIILLVTGVN